MDHLSPFFDNYHRLVDRVDRHIDHVRNTYKDQIACKKGCDHCCRFLNLFPVEALVLAQGFARLPDTIKFKVRRKVQTDKGACPLLIDRTCVLYPVRPVICRTHGYPFYMEKDGKSLIDFCPENFKGITSFPKEMMIDMEHLNALISVINRQFILSVNTEPCFKERIPVSEAIFILQDWPGGKGVSIS